MRHITGRNWEPLDAIKMRVEHGHLGNFEVVSSDGIPLVGATGHPGPTTVIIAVEWTSAPTQTKEIA